MFFKAAQLRLPPDGIVRWTLGFFRPHGRHLAILSALALSEIGLRALTPWPLKHLIDHLAAPNPRGPYVVGAAAAGLLIQVAHELVLMGHTRLQARLAQNVVFDLRTLLFTHLQSLPFAEHQARPPADTVYRLDADAACVEMLLLRGILPSVFSALTLTVMFGILLQLDPLLALLSVVIVPVLYIGLRLHARRIRPKSERVKALESAVINRVYESFNAIRLVKTFAREDYERRRFEGAARSAMRERLAVTDDESRFSFLVAGATVAGSAAVLAIGGLHVVSGQLSLGSLLVVMSYLGFVYGPMSAIANTVGSLHGALASARRVRDTLALAKEPAGGSIRIGRLRGEVQFEDVTFGYVAGTPVLSGISFVAHAGERIALVGPSGGGKTSLVSLMTRLHEPASGRILLDGIDARDLDLRSLRENIAKVPQQSFVLSGTVAENLAFGRPDATREEMTRAAQAANADAFISELPNGYDTVVGAGGRPLSGGQQQRLSIARAFLKDAPILVLDEPTSALDALSESVVLEALDSLQRGRTTFIIAHRLSTVRGADRILVVEHGRIVAQGRHDDLLRVSALYRRLCAELEPVSAGAAVGA